MIGALASLDQIGAWRIGDRLGSGGQGMVFHATRSGEGFQQRGALKVLVGRLANDDALRRFKRERRLLASLDHPGIPTLLDGGVLDDGSPWLVVELVDGETLSDRLKHGVLPPRAAADLVINLCGILSHAHQRLIAHLDLKPGNVMLEQGDGVRLLDFGVARLLDDTSDHTEQTHSAYTPAFAAPEQIDQRPTGTATDIYAAGALLFAATVGRPPVSADNVSAQFEQVLWAEPKLPASIPTDLAAIIQRCLRKDPAERYASIDSLEADLHAFRRGQPVKARAGGWRYRLTRLVARHRAASAVLGVLLLGMLGSAGVYVGQKSEIREQRDLAELEAARANRMLSFLERSLTSLNSDYSTSPTVGQFLHKAVDEVDEIRDPVAQVRILRLLSSALDYRGEAMPAVDAMARALPLIEESELRGGAEHVNALLALSEGAIDNGHLEDGARLAGDALDLAKQSRDSIPFDLELGALGRLAWALAEQGENERVSQLTDPYLNSIKDISSESELNAYGLIAIMASRVAVSDQRRYELASQMHEAVMAAFPGRPTAQVREKVVLGTRALDLGRVREALKRYREAEAAVRASTDGEPFLASFAIIRQATIHRMQGDFAPAGERLAEAATLVIPQGKRMEHLLAAEQILLAVDVGRLNMATGLLAKYDRSPPPSSTSAARALGQARARWLLAVGATAAEVSAAAPDSMEARIAQLRESCTLNEDTEVLRPEPPSLSYRLWEMASARCAFNSNLADQLRDELVADLGPSHWMTR
ncbi:MAG: serine/threonine-protein kinase [Pseudomonadota bacterium]